MAGAVKENAAEACSTACKEDQTASMALAAGQVGLLPDVVPPTTYNECSGFTLSAVALLLILQNQIWHTMTQNCSNAANNLAL